MAISITNIYEILGKGGTGSPGDNLSLAHCVLGTPPSVNPNNVSATYNVVGNAWGYSPIGANTISMGNIQSYYNAGDFINNTNPRMYFKFAPTADIAADLYGDNISYPRTFPYNQSQLGVKMNNTNVTGGGILGTYTYAANSYTTWTSVAAGDSYKFPNAANNSATICFWFKPAVQASNRNFLWADADAVGDVNPYRGWWLQYNTGNTIGFSRGDGTGAASSDRYSWTGTAVFDGSGDFWQFAAVLVSNDENTVSTGTNYMWGYAYSSRTGTWSWTNGATYLSGTAGAMAWSGDSGTETTNCMIINPLGNTSAGLVMDIGHIYVFNGELTTTQVEYVRELTDGYTY